MLTLPVGLNLPVGAGGDGRPLRVLAIGAHADDIEIGAGGTLLQLAGSVPCEARLLVLSADPVRSAEARGSGAAFLAGATSARVDTHEIPDGRFPAHWDEVKDVLENARDQWSPDLILAPGTADAHQDHRLVADLVTTVYRDHLVLGYEIPKWDGDLGRPTVYVPLSAALLARKIELLQEHFVSQRGRDWFDDEVFRGLARLRGMECRSPYAEAFSCHKMALTFGPR